MKQSHLKVIRILPSDKTETANSKNSFWQSITNKHSMRKIDTRAVPLLHKPLESHRELYENSNVIWDKNRYRVSSNKCPCTVLGQFPREKLLPNPKTNANSNPNLNRGQLSGCPLYAYLILKL